MSYPIIAIQFQANVLLQIIYDFIIIYIIASVMYNIFVGKIWVKMKLGYYYYYYYGVGEDDFDEEDFDEDEDFEDFDLDDERGEGVFSEEGFILSKESFVFVSGIGVVATDTSSFWSEPRFRGVRGFFKSAAHGTASSLGAADADVLFLGAAHGGEEVSSTIMD